MGLALLIVILKTIALRRNDRVYDEAARFWGKILGIAFVLGVVTGIPMEFEFGTNWAVFSRFAGGVIGQTLAMEGMFAFFLESAFLGLFLYGEKRLSPVRTGCRQLRCSSVRGSRVTSLLRPTLSCSIRSDTLCRTPARMCRCCSSPVLAVCFEPLGALAVCAQYERCGNHGRLRDDGGRRFLSTFGRVD